MFSTKDQKKNLNTTIKAAMMTLTFAATFSTAYAEQGRGGQHKGKPPQEAFTACADHTEEGGFCSFETPEGDTIEGTCKTPRREEASLICKPSRDSKRNQRE